MSLPSHARTLLTSAVLTLSILGTSSIAQAAQDKSLEAFCLRTKVDTPENCRCGQKRANKIASKEEQNIMLKMMTSTPGAQQKKLMESLGPAKMEAIMEKLNKITSGC